MMRPDGNLIRGGAEVQIDRTKEALEDLGHEVQILGPLDRTVGDIVHFFGPWESHWYCAATLLERGIPYVCSPIWLSSHSVSQEKLRRLRHRTVGRFPRLLGKLFQRANKLLVCSQWEQDRIASYFELPGERFDKLPNGVERKFWNADPRPFAQAFELTTPFLLHTGSFCPRKNQLSLIRAVKGLDIPAVFLGQKMDADYYAQCKAEADSKMKLGELPSESDLLPSAYAGARVFCLPSTQEGLSLSALEAAVSGCGLVLGSTWGAQEHFGEDTKYVDPHDVNAIRTAVQEIWQSPPDRKTSAESFQKRYSWEGIAKRLAGIYEGVLAGTK